MTKWVPFSPTAIRSIRQSTARINIWEGAVRSSKTVCSLVRWIDYVATAPPGALLMTGKTERTLKRNILDPLEDILGPRRFKLNRGAGELQMLGRRIYLAGANDERAEQKIRGLTLAGALGDELTLWPESFLKMLLSRLSVPGACFFGTTNPDSPYHWLKTDFLDRQDSLNLRSWKFRLSDNLSLSQDYIDALKAEYTGLWRRRFIDGDWVAAEGAIYDMFDESIHVYRDENLPDDILHWFVGCDYGTSNPTVFLLVGVDPRGCLWVHRENRYDPSARGGRQRTDQEHVGEFARWLLDIKVSVHSIFIDPSAASFILALRRAGQRGIRLADNSVLDGIRRTASLLQQADVRINASCRGVLGEITAYAWDPKQQEKGLDAPLKRDDHSMDALRYLVNGTRHLWERRHRKALAS